MKMFTKLALVSSMAISANAMAMQAMDDAALSSATGQDGINIGIGIARVDIEKVLIHDNDGLEASKTFGVTNLGGKDAAGAIVIKGNGVSGDTNETKGIVITPNASALLDNHMLANLVIDTDAGRTTSDSTSGNTAFLNVAAEVSGLNIAVGEIGVSASVGAGAGDSGTGIRRGAYEANNYNKILSGLTVKTGKMNANIQLGAAPQGAMILLNTSMTGGLEITDLGIFDASTQGATVGYTAGADTVLGTLDDVAVVSTTDGEIRLDSIKIADASGDDLTVNAAVSVVGESLAGANDGYLRIVTGATPTDMYISGIHLGSATAGSIGDVEVQGLQTYRDAAGTVPGMAITISGHH